MDNSTSDRADKLAQYFDGELIGAEKENFEQQLVADKTLQNELDSLKLTAGAIKLYGLKNRVSDIHQSMMKEMRSPVRKLHPNRKIVRYSMGVAASLILLVGGYIAYNFFALSPEKVFASRYQSYELVALRDGTTNETPVEKAYQEKNYKEVIRIHDAGEDRTPKGEFLCGAAALEVKDNNKAIKCFNEVLDVNKQSPKPVLKDEAEYYLSLGYIRNKDYDYALYLLTKIKDDPNHTYNKKITDKFVRQVKILRRR